MQILEHLEESIFKEKAGLDLNYSRPDGPL